MFYFIVQIIAVTWNFDELEKKKGRQLMMKFSNLNAKLD